MERRRAAARRANPLKGVYGSDGGIIGQRCDRAEMPPPSPLLPCAVNPLMLYILFSHFPATNLSATLPCAGLYGRER